MTKSEARAWAYDMAAALLVSDADMGEVIEPDATPGTDDKLKADAYRAVIAELRAKSAKAALSIPRVKCPHCAFTVKRAPTCGACNKPL